METLHFANIEARRDVHGIDDPLHGAGIGDPAAPAGLQHARPHPWVAASFHERFVDNQFLEGAKNQHRHRTDSSSTISPLDFKLPTYFSTSGSTRSPGALKSSTTRITIRCHDS